MPETASPLIIRTMRRDELPLTVEWAAQEGWNPGLHDAAPFFAADPGGFLIGELDGEPVSLISAVRYGSTYGFIGFYIVKPEFRGKGYGWAIWQAALARLQGRTVGLDGVVAQQDNYRRSGFELAHRNARYAGQQSAGGPPAAASSVNLVPISQLPPEALQAYDRSFFPAARADFLQAWVTQPGTVALAVPGDGGLLGYGVVRPCRTGYKIGPLFADSPAIADAIFSAVLQHVPAGEPFYLDVMTTQPAAVELATRRGMLVVFETARMYLGAAPAISPDRTYGITSFELG
ncbi:GNAT family N-acetyltransferase [Casimicrobium huifangae]|uniref:GNAT family N-acetyltransferase n=1 Tax=Casimicrobium huifangae TaxID=2591109 RepID=UPI001EE2A0D5|nr:GNAT family N-acetyltransferase [Casimicrobium huifangae]